MAFDFKKEYKEFYMPKNKPAIVTVPKANYIAVRGKGNPNEEGGAYQQAISVLYAVAYTLRMSYKTDYKIAGFFEYVVPPLEGFWWQENIHGVNYADKDSFNWISVIRLPDFVNQKDFEWAVETATIKKKIDCLNDIIARLEKRNKRLDEDVEKYRKDYLNYFDEYAKLRDKDFNRNLEEINNLNKNSLIHNARGAGRKAKFTDDQVDEIRRLREDGNTIKEIAKRYNCSVGLIHKLINEK